MVRICASFHLNYNKIRSEHSQILTLFSFSHFQKRLHFPSLLSCPFRTSMQTLCTEKHAERKVKHDPAISWNLEHIFQLDFVTPILCMNIACTRVSHSFWRWFEFFSFFLWSQKYKFKSSNKTIQRKHWKLMPRRRKYNGRRFYVIHETFVCRKHWFPFSLLFTFGCPFVYTLNLSWCLFCYFFVHVAKKYLVKDI